MREFIPKASLCGRGYPYENVNFVSWITPSTNNSVHPPAHAQRSISGQYIFRRLAEQCDPDQGFLYTFPRLRYLEI